MKQGLCGGLGISHLSGVHSLTDISDLMIKTQLCQKWPKGNFNANVWFVYRQIKRQLLLAPMFSSFSAPSRKDCDFFCCIIVCTAFCSTCRRETSHARSFSETCHVCLFWLLARVNSEKPHDIPNGSMRLSGAKSTWCFYQVPPQERLKANRLLHPPIHDIPFLCDMKSCWQFGMHLWFSKSVRWSNLLDVYNRRHWPHVDTRTTEEVVDNQETHTNNIFDSSCTPPGKISREFF